ncbi:uncharacterized protein LOC112345189 isoform X2 [Selaginella moellendorffii]|uniref:uncharacterized protein LOC112345189 isoform X2 n=1 Tax=Selaginella moellendorffii TaxID=88036 RepID=UPI000D1C6B0A|nr:uncharacterized protein LOC112345189 isoform X2 [Selaginella moellendorffii]|eukprot:XP_024527255.1 uncharacterized protein LOC112345189 isoform X2 [Selaginella moellendorffii]
MARSLVSRDKTIADIQAARWREREDAVIKSAIEFLIEGAKLSKYCQTPSRKDLSRRLEKILEPARYQTYAPHFPRGDDFGALGLSTLNSGRERNFNDAEIQTSRSLEGGFTGKVSDNSQILSETKDEVVAVVPLQQSQSGNTTPFEMKMDKLITEVVSKWLQSSCPLGSRVPAGSSSPDRLRLYSRNNQLTENLGGWCGASSAVKKGISQNNDLRSCQLQESKNNQYKKNQQG